MATIKKQLKKFGRRVWELFKSSLPAMFMYFCAGLILMMLAMRGEKAEWTDANIAWTVVCIVAGAAYNGLMGWANGGSEYEMLVSGNVKRMSEEQFEGGYKMSSHKEAKEYRVWKGFVMGSFIAVFPILFGVLLGCHQSTIHSGEEFGKGVAALLLLSFLFSGWSTIPSYLMNSTGIYSNYFLTCLYGLIPIAVTGAFYIIGAYARRNKRLREQLVAQKAAEAEANKVKKINYGGLPGTKPKKRK